METFFYFMKMYLEPLRNYWWWTGVEEVGLFIGTHLISGMIPAFFIAGAIAVFLDKQRITRYMGHGANPMLAYPLAALSGGILTVCSCGVLPIFASILHQGAGVGPAFTFLMASPAVNLISLMYTYTLLGWEFTLGRTMLVVISSIAIGIGMRVIFSQKTVETPTPVYIEETDERKDWQIALLFVVLVIVMLTSTGVFDSFFRSTTLVHSSPLLSRNQILFWDYLLSKILVIFGEIAVLAAILWKWFPFEETKLWLRKSKDLFWMIIPKVIAGIFFSGLLKTLLPLVNFVQLFDNNSIHSNLLASIIGSLMYFGTIIGVNIVATLNRLGMHNGPALTLLLSGPAVSLPSILALIPMIGVKKSGAFFGFVIITSCISGILFGFFHA